ncbi:MAG: Tex family protein [Tissierellia bacterium]|nr:Tex family protein [Tissierellia bacterium]
MDITAIVADNFKLDQKNVKNAIELMDEGSTIAFIARYRKEKTGNLIDEQLREIESLVNKLRNLEKRQQEIISSLESQDKLTKELELKILNSKTQTELEDIYQPFKKKRKTRADKAKEMGLEILSNLVFEDKDKEEFYKKAVLIKDTNLTKDQLIEKSLDIIAEDLSNNIQIRNIIRRDAFVRARIVCEKKNDENNLYQNYYDLDKKIKDLKSFQILAINRAEKNDALTVKMNFSDQYNKTLISNLFNLKTPFSKNLLDKAIDDSYKRLLLPQIKTEIKNNITEKAEDESIKVFSKNLKPYLLQKPVLKQNIIGLDPGYRTGCKVSVVDKMGKYLESTVIYPAKPKEDIEGSIRVLNYLIDKYDVTLIALGNGTASRETESMLKKLLDSTDKKLSYAIVNEAGASIYSASKLAKEEFPNLDVTIRSSISLARRLQDPMAELVKIDPKHIGVGQYQHDLNQKKLDDQLNKVVTDAVNEVGVNINNASFSLLSYVSGLSVPLAKRIEEMVKNGELNSREDLKKVKGLGEKTFKLSSGFLRFPDSKNILDNTAVHPESYGVANKIIGRDLDKIDLEKVSEELEVGKETLKDIIKELKKPGRDPRENNPDVITKSEVVTIDDLKEGMIIKGKVRNVTDFGCFVDIGVGIDALVHISNMSEKFIKDPSDIVKVSDIIEVKIIEIDKKRERIGLSMKGI